MCVDGSVDVKDKDEQVTVSKGESLFIPSGDGKVDIKGKGKIVMTKI